MAKTIYFVQSECNDNGWHSGFNYFEKKEDAVKLMRNYVARQIWNERAEGNKIEHFHVLRDSVMGKAHHEDSINITFKVTNKEFETFFWEYRVWSAELYDHELPKWECINY